MANWKSILAMDGQSFSVHWSVDGAIYDLDNWFFQDYNDDGVGPIIAIVGHGSPGAISMGDGLAPHRAGQDIDINLMATYADLGNLETELSGITAYRVYLYACNLGSGSSTGSGIALMKEIANTTGANVYAPDVYVWTTPDALFLDNGGSMVRVWPGEYP